MTDIFVDLPPPAEQRVMVLYAWVATHANGAEGIIGGWLDGQPMSLVTSSRKIADMMAELAEHVRVMGEKATGKPISKRLVRYMREGDAT